MIFTRGLHQMWSLIVAALLLVGCGGSSPTVVHQPRATASSTGRSPFISSTAELLSVPAVGRIYGRCKPGDRVWTIEFAAAPQTATDSVTYRIGSARPRAVETGPGRETLTWRLVPGRVTSDESADRVSGFPATTIKTTQPITIDIRQATEPHVFVVRARLAVAAAIGDTTNCALVSSRVNATTYYPGGQPAS
ncbi:MAG: hypothetical protein ACR2LV_09020 [Solirubrobacteraceae bacterium]